VLKVDGINQYYGGSHILRNVGFEAKAGEVTVILGRNGVGKTTLLKSLMGVVPVKTGSIALDGVAITRDAPYARVRQGVGYVPQGREIFGRLTVQENLRMGLAYKSGSTPIPAELFELFPVLKAMLHRRGGDLSGRRAQAAAAGRAHRRHPAQHHQGYRPRDPDAQPHRHGWRPADGDRAGRAVLRLRRRARRPVPGDGARRDRPARPRRRHAGRRRAPADVDLRGGGSGRGRRMTFERQDRRVVDSFGA
jgi:hypothetical protein